LGRRSGPLLREPAQRDLELGGAGGRPDLGGPVREFGERQLPAADHRLALLLGDGAGVGVWLLPHRRPSAFMLVTRSAARAAVRVAARILAARSENSESVSSPRPTIASSFCWAMARGSWYGSCVIGGRVPS